MEENFAELLEEFLERFFGMIVSVSERKNQDTKKGAGSYEKHKWIKGMAVALCLVSMTGCGAAETPGTDSGNVPVVEENQQAENNGELQRRIHPIPPI